MIVLLNFPLMLVPFAVYNLFELMLALNPWEDIVIRVQMMSGVDFTLTLGESLICLSLVLLFFEILKATRIATLSIVDHLVSTLVFIAFLVEFLLVEQAATSTFFILTVLALIDVLAGYAVSVRNAARDLTSET
ncbi:MAG: hypothetical protein ACOVOI_07240 [Hyphomicrobiales bacterium]